MRIRLRVRLRPDSPPEDREFTVESLRLGRAPSADVVVGEDAAQTVSWQHARVDVTPEGPTLSDLKSTNGTFLNGRKVEVAERLSVGDTFRLGQTGPMFEVVALELHDRPPAPSPVPREPAPSRERSPSPPPMPRPAAAPPAHMSATRALLVSTQKKQRLWMFSAAGVLVVAGLIISFILWRHETRLDNVEEEIAKINSRFVDVDADLETVKAKQLEIDASTQTWYSDTESLDKAVASGRANGETIYQRTVRSTAWVIGDQGGDGSGSVVEHNGKLLIVTSYHVIHGSNKIGVRFPEILDGKVLANTTHYIRDDAPSRKESIPCQVWASDPEVDLAVLEPQTLPGGMRPLKLAQESPSPGSDVHTVGGDPAESSARWSYSRGTVRQVNGPVELRTRTGRTVRARIVETQNPVNRGDSGGPLVNNKCELVGVTFGGVEGANLVTRFIEAGHVKDILKNKPQKRITPPPAITPTPSTPVVQPKAPTAPKAQPAPASREGHVYALMVMDDHDPNIGQGCRNDLKNMQGLFHGGLPAGSYTIRTLEHQQATNDGIRRYYQEMRGTITPADTVFFYYTGHGGTDRGTNAHFLAMQKNGRNSLARGELYNLAHSMGGRLTVIITDCCSSWAGPPSREAPPTTEFSRIQFLAPLLKKCTGVVDWQAASPGYPALGPATGGIFTTNFCNATSSGSHRSWSTLFADVQTRTQRATSVRKPPQTPYQFPDTTFQMD